MTVLMTSPLQVREGGQLQGTGGAGCETAAAAGSGEVSDCLKWPSIASQIEDSKELYKNSTAQLAGLLSAFTSQLNLASGETEEQEEWGEEVGRHRGSLGGGGAVARRSRVVMGTQRRSSARCTLPRRQAPSGSSQQAGTSSSLVLEGDLSSLEEDGSWSSSGKARGAEGRKKKESILKKVMRSVRSLVSGSSGSSRTGEEATSSGSKRATS